MLTYGDAVSDVDLDRLLACHREHGRLLTMTTVQPGGRFGVLDVGADGVIRRFMEKRKEDGGWVNAGFMVVEPQVLNYIEGDSTVFEQAPLEMLASEGQMQAYQHTGFWQCMDTQREKQTLEKLWASDTAPWKVWED